jgi:hypothetical protein
MPSVGASVFGMRREWRPRNSLDGNPTVLPGNPAEGPRSAGIPEDNRRIVVQYQRLMVADGHLG